VSGANEPLHSGQRNLYTLVDDPFGTYNLTTNMGGAELVFELPGMG